MKFSFLQKHKNKPSAQTSKGMNRGFFYPLREWTIGLFFVIGIFFCGVAYIAYDFYTQFVADEDIVIIDDKPIQYKDSEVKEYADKYIEREKIFNELRSHQKIVVPEEMVRVTPTTTPSENPQTDPLADEAGDGYTTIAP